MISGLKQLIITLGLLIATGFSSWLIIHYQLQDKESEKLILDHPDSFAEQVTILQMDHKGQISHEINIEKMVHYPVHNVTYFIKPHILFLAVNQAAWSLTAKYGRAINGAEQIDLWEDVQVTQQDTSNHPTWNLTTTALSYYPTKQLVTTHRPVTLIGPGSRLSTKGMQLYLSQGHFNLFNNHYETPLPTL